MAESCTIRIGVGSDDLLRCLYFSDTMVFPGTLVSVFSNVKLFTFQMLTVALVEQDDDASCDVTSSAAMAVTAPSLSDHNTFACSY